MRLDISFTILYDRIDFLYRQCELFAGERERALLERDLGKLYLSVDRQKLLVNWTTKASRKNTQLLSIATADQATGYVFAANINFDATLDSEDVEREGQAGNMLGCAYASDTGASSTSWAVSSRSCA